MSYDVLTPAAATLWPYAPNWSAGFNVRRAFATDIFGSRDATEQRRATRINPRFSIDYRAALTDVELRAAREWLRTRQNAPAIVPDFVRYAFTTGASSAGASTLTVSPMPVWAGDGQRLVLCATGLKEAVEVASVAGTTITLADPLTNAWPSGSVLRPTFHGLLDGRITGGRFNRAAAEISIALEAYPGGEPPRATGTAWSTVGSREVFTAEPDFARQPSLNFLWPVENVDFGRGRTAQFRPIGVSQHGIEAEFNGLGLAATAEIEQFFDRMKGRRGAFYLPTGDNDGVFVSSGGSSVTVSGTGLATQFSSFDFATYEYGVAVCLIGGTKLYRRIASVASGGGNSTITVTSAWGATVDSGSVARISLMPLVRFAGDEMTTSWVTPASSRLRLTFQSVRV